MSKHTPGPWIINYAGGLEAGEGVIPHHANSIGPHGAGNVCHVYYGDYPTGTPIADYPQAIEENIANARLIAAAPDLLEALERLLPNVEYLADGRAEVIAQIKDATAAITKAKGE